MRDHKHWVTVLVPLIHRVSDQSKPERARIEEIENLLLLAAARSRDGLVPALLSRNGAGKEEEEDHQDRVPVSAGAG